MAVGAPADLQKTKRSASSTIVFWLKLLITAGLVAYLLSRIDVGSVLRQVRRIDPARAILALLVMLFQLGLVSLRWQLINHLVDARTRIGQTFRLTFIGQFFNQVLPSGVGGDVVRAWLVSRDGVPLGRAITGVLCDRAVALVVLLLIVAGTFFVLPASLSAKIPAIDSLRIVALAGVASIAALIFFGVPVSRILIRYPITESIGKLIRDLRKVLCSPVVSPLVMILAAAIQFLLVATISLCAEGMNIHLEFSAALMVVPTVMLISMIPISFAGWGLRETAMILGLGVVGISAPDALAVSVAFGLSHLIVGLPGGVLWLMRSDEVRMAGRSK